MSPRCAAGQEGEQQEEGAGEAVGCIQERGVTVGGEIGTDNPQEGKRLALGLLGRNVPEMGTLVDKVEEGAELEVRGATGVDHTVSWADCDKGPCTS